MSLKNYVKLQKSTFIPLFNYFELTGVRKSPFFRSDSLGLLVNTLTADDEYFRQGKDKLRVSIQIQLSKKAKTSCAFLWQFYNLH